MDCYYHHTTKSVTSCERCNRPICSDCIVSFKNRMRYIDRNEIQKERELDPDYEYDRLEDLNWCLACYYAHYNYEIHDKDSSLLVDSLLSVLFLTILVVGGIGLLSFFAHVDISIDLMSPTVLLEGSVVYALAIFLLYRNKSSILKIKKEKIDVVKERFLTITNVGTIDLPIECYYCKHEIDPEAMACLNLDCSLGEKIYQTGPEVEIQAVNSNYGLFDTLKPLPKYPEEKEKED